MTHTDKGALHFMTLQNEPFCKIASGKKSIELRLYDEKRSAIKAGDAIEFTNSATKKTLLCRVKKIYVFKSFSELYSNLPLEKCGYEGAELASASPGDMDRYYSPQEQAKYGVVGIELDVIGQAE